MLSEEQAIENLKDFKSINVLYGNKFVMFLEQLKKYQESTEIVLNIIDRLNQYIKENEIKETEKNIDRLVEEQEEQEKYVHSLEKNCSKKIIKLNY